MDMYRGHRVGQIDRGGLVQLLPKRTWRALECTVTAEHRRCETRALQ